jgi:hypothetical protein
MAIFNHLDEPAEMEEILAESEKQHSEGGIILASDMDGSMFRNDLGLLVFLEKLGDPRLWEFDETRFAALLLPRKYRKALCQGREGLHGKQMPPEICSLAMDLHTDIVRLYTLIQKLGREKTRSKEVARLVNEFARKMMEFDRIFLKLDRYLSSLFGGQLLMRTRFFAGKEPKDVRRLTETVMSRSHTNPARILTLNIHEENRREAQQIVTEDRIRNVHDEESPLMEIDRLVIPIDSVRKLIREAIERLNVHAIVVTANLQGIADTAINESTYNFLREQPADGQIVTGSRLITNGKKLEPKLDGQPMFGPIKALEALTIAKKLRRKLGIAIGDSPSTDGPMMLASLDEGGLAFIVTEDPKQAMEKFSDALELNTKNPDATRRIYRITPNGS